MINQTNAAGIRKLSISILTAVMTVILALVIFASSAFAGLINQYNVEIMIDQEKFVVTTNETEPMIILSQSNVEINDSDRIDISNFTIGEGGVIKVDRLKALNVEFDGVIKSYQVYGDTVKAALNEIGIELDGTEKMNYQSNDATIDGMVISIESSKSVSINADGKENKYAMHTGTVKDALALAQIELGENDFTKPSLDTQLKDGMKIKVYRVELITKNEKVSIKYKTITKTDKKMNIGEEKTITKGVNGEAQVQYEIKLVNGKEASKKEISRTITKKPVSKVVKVGSNSSVKSNGIKSKNGYKVGQKLRGTYTHYCACGICGSGTGRTASGKKVYNGMKNPYYIACNWLPMGSVVNIDGTNYTVVDRGGSGLSNRGRVDIFTPQGHKACFKYGKGKCDLTIVRLGW